MPLLEILGALGGVGSLIQGVGNLFRGNNQVDEQRELQELQIEGSKELTDYQKKKELELFRQTGIGEQLRQMKENDLSPGLLMKGSGIGGTTGGSAGMPTGGVAPTQVDRQRLALGIAEQMSNLGLIQAQTQKTLAEANKIKGVDTKVGEATVLNLTQDVNNKIANQKLTEIQTSIQNINKTIAENTLDATMDKIVYESQQAEHELNILKNNELISQETVNTKIKLINQELTNSALQAVAIKQGIKLDQARISEITNGISQKWQELQIKGTQSRYEHEDRLTAIKEYTANALKTAGIIAAGQLVGDIVKIATRQMPKTKE